MTNHTQPPVDLQAIGKRLGILISKFPGGIDDAAKVSGLSKITLNRYLDGSQSRIQLIPISHLCYAKRISIMWVIYGAPHSMEAKQGAQRD
jgi:hypothetical protein